jgi:hypothetical protein
MYSLENHLIQRTILTNYVTRNLKMSRSIGAYNSTNYYALMLSPTIFDCYNTTENIVGI